MYTPQEISQLKREFYTTLGKYMAPVPNADGEHINWMNYHTGIKHVYLRLDGDQYGAYIAIEITHGSDWDRKAWYQKLAALKGIFHDTVGETWVWEEDFAGDHGRLISKIGFTLSGFSLYNRSQWPVLISFFKQRLISFDAFWCNARHSFD